MATKHRYQTKFNEVVKVMVSSPKRHWLAQSLLTVLFSPLELSSSSYEVKLFLPLDICISIVSRYLPLDIRMTLKELCFQKFTTDAGDIL